MDARWSGQASLSAVAAELMRIVDAEVRQSGRERGRVPDGSQEELPYRPAAHRVDRLVARAART